LRAPEFTKGGPRGGLRGPGPVLPEQAEGWAGSRPRLVRCPPPRGPFHGPRAPPVERFPGGPGARPRDPHQPPEVCFLPRPPPAEDPRFPGAACPQGGVVGPRPPGRDVPKVRGAAPCGPVPSPSPPDVAPDMLVPRFPPAECVRFGPGGSWAFSPPFKNLHGGPRAGPGPLACDPGLFGIRRRSATFPVTRPPPPNRLPSRVPGKGLKASARGWPRGRARPGRRFPPPRRVPRYPRPGMGW